MRSPKPYSRAEMNGELRRWSLRNKRLLATLLVLATSVVAALTVLHASTPGGSTRSLFFGVMIGGVIISFAWMFHLAFLAHSPKAIFWLRGAWGEDATRDELKRASRRGVIWGSVDSINFERGDIDHFVVTRRGGLVVIDSKFRTGTSDVDQSQMEDAARRIQRQAEWLTTKAIARSKGRHRDAATFTVRPVIVMWGPERQLLEETSNLGGVAVVSGNRLITWMKGLEEDHVDEQIARTLLASVQEWSENQRHLTSAARGV